MNKKSTFRIFISLLIIASQSVILINAQEENPIKIDNVETVARVTGPKWQEEEIPNPNQTHENYAVRATDLGVIWDATTSDGQEKVMIAFGDTYDDGWHGFGGGGSSEGWRSNVLAISSDKDLSDGLTFDGMIMDDEKEDFAKEIIYSAKETHGYGDFTAIPTAGITVGDTHYIHYMQIKKWGDPGQWDTNFSEIVYSNNEGEDWEVSDVQWGADSNFAMASFIKEDGYVYMFGTPSGRFGDLHIARVAEEAILEQESYEYWDGEDWVVGDETQASPIVEAPVSELSVQYNSHFDKWVMMYLNEDKYSVVMRTSDDLVEGWSEEEVVVTGQEYPQLYGTYIHPWTNGGEEIYFVMTLWEPYNVILLRVDLALEE